MTRWFVLFAVVSIVTQGSADDWPQWRGENRDSNLGKAEQIDELTPGKMVRKWTAKIGGGYTGPTVADGRVFVMDRGLDPANQRERVLCFSEEDGRLIWEHSYPCRYTVSYSAGPRAAVTVDKGKAFAVGAMGHFHCLDTKSGKVLWSHDLLEEYSIRMPIWGIAGSPLVYKNLVIQIVAGEDDACVVAFDCNTGEEVWRSLNERAGYSSPILIKQGGQDVVVCWTGESVSGISPADGKQLWSVPMPPSRMPIGVPTPVVSGDKLFVSSFYDGSLLVEFDQAEPRAKKLWHRVGQNEKKTDALHCMIGNPVIRGDHIYGVDSYGQLRCLEMATGDRVWESTDAVKRNRWATVQIIKNGEKEIFFNEQGQVILATLSPTGFVEHSRAELISPTKLQLNRRDGVTWAHPAVANGHIFARSDEELVCAELK